MQMFEDALICKYRKLYGNDPQIEYDETINDNELSLESLRRKRDRLIAESFGIKNFPTQEKIMRMDDRQKIELWNWYTATLDVIGKFSNLRCGQYKVASFEKHISRNDSSQTITFIADPKLHLESETVLMEQMRDYQPIQRDPIVRLPSLVITLDRKWIERESMLRVMEVLQSKLQLDNLPKFGLPYKGNPIE